MVGGSETFTLGQIAGWCGLSKDATARFLRALGVALDRLARGQAYRVSCEQLTDADDCLLDSLDLAANAKSPIAAVWSVRDLARAARMTAKRMRARCRRQRVRLISVRNVPIWALRTTPLAGQRGANAKSFALISDIQRQDPALFAELTGGVFVPREEQDDR